MNELQKYKNVIIYVGLVIGLIFLAYNQIQPKVVATINSYNQLKSQKETDANIANQLNTAKDKAERKKKLRMLDDMTKRIYEQDDGTIDPDTTFAFLLDDAIEILRKHHVKTHSIRSSLNPEDDVFVKGNGAKYAACKLDMKIISDYTDFKGFLEDLYKYPYLVNINNIEIYPYQKDKKILLINFTLTMYAARSDEQAASISEAQNAEGQEGNPEENQNQNQDQPQ